MGLMGKEKLDFGDELEACGEVSYGEGLRVCVCDCICSEVGLIVMVFTNGVFVVDGGAFTVGVCWFVLAVL
ncbi:transmembrane protein, putative [Medicago truncatula]|uniref:Transmembrane protein, putative n=1 Tax=Medicago truncatula TaxID=3880 RepID=A0A072UCA5_MEDTR|nr:transmembrane protein, putative [Medicago truncatula]